MVPEGSIGPYQIVCELGRGGMGSTHLARRDGFGRFEKLMAIKLIHPELSQESFFVDTFLDEARIAALIRHPNVVPVYEVGEHQGRHFIAMDYSSGEPLSILFDNTWCLGTPLDIEIAVHIVTEVCTALHAAHELTSPHGRKLDVVHRDICPQNILLGYDGTTRVMDFGYAKALFQLFQGHPEMYRSRVPYLAPEQIRHESIDRRSDIFSLGVTLWESTVGMRLFKGETDTESANKVLDGRVPRPTRVRESYPPQLEAIVLKALNPRPELRYQTALEMEHALRAFLVCRRSTVSSSDLEALLTSRCKLRFEQRKEMERRAAGPTFELPIEEDTSPLFAVGDTNLPVFSIGEVSVDETTADPEVMVIEYLEEELEEIEEIEELPVLPLNADVSAATIEIPRELIAMRSLIARLGKMTARPIAWQAGAALCVIGLIAVALAARGQDDAALTAPPPAHHAPEPELPVSVLRMAVAAPLPVSSSPKERPVEKRPKVTRKRKPTAKQLALGYCSEPKRVLVQPSEL